MSEKTITMLTAEHAMNELAAHAHDNAVDHGFYEDIQCTVGYLMEQRQHALAVIAQQDFTLAQLAKIASECGEAVGALQRDKGGEFSEELADIVIRVFDLAAWRNINIGSFIVDKMRKNEARPYRHGKLC